MADLTSPPLSPGAPSLSAPSAGAPSAGAPSADASSISAPNPGVLATQSRSAQVSGATLQRGPVPPPKLHLGSGKSFKPDYLNVDIDPLWRPDLVLDLAQPLPSPSTVHDTKRFGDVRLVPGSFEEILAVDVREHVPDLPAIMRNCRDLLQEGGVMRISVPYDLSLGAWSDPTHVRAFNERSWDYFTQWTWYFGWRDHRFQMTKLDFIASEYGQRLSQEGRTLEDVLRTPRAVDSMYVELTKVPFQQADWNNLRHYHERARQP